MGVDCVQSLGFNLWVLGLVEKKMFINPKP